MTKAILIPVDGPIENVELDGSIQQLQTLVGGGNIEALSLPSFIPDADASTAYINEEGKYRPDLEANPRATDFMLPGVGLWANDYIAGPFLLVGFDPNSGEHTDELPQAVVNRARLIELEAA